MALALNYKSYLLCSLLLLIPIVSTRVEETEDRDLTGCSVELNSFIFNLNGLKKGSPK